MSRAVAKKKNPRSSRPDERAHNPGPSTRTLIILGITAAVIVGGAIVWSRSAGAAVGTGDPRDQVRGKVKAIVDQAGGAITASQATDTLYVELYPNCPEILDPDNPEHVDCMEDWLDIYAVALEYVGDPASKPSTSPGKTGPSYAAQYARRTKDLLSSLSTSQRTELKRIFGPQLTNELEQAAQQNQEMWVRQVLGRMQDELNSFPRAKQIVELTSLTMVLGPKADEFAWLLKA